MSINSPENDMEKSLNKISVSERFPDNLDASIRGAIQAGFAGNWKADKATKSVWLYALPWLATAAVTLFVFWLMLEPGKQESSLYEMKKPHFLALKGMENCRYIGIVGDLAILEFKNEKGSEQVKVKAGDKIDGYKILSFSANQIEFENAKGEKFLIRAKGLPGLVKKAEGEMEPFTLFGKCLDESGKPVAGAKIWAKGETGSVFQTSYSDEDGNYEMELAFKVNTLHTGDSYYATMEKVGPWEKTTRVDFDPRKDTFVLEGKVLDENGKPLSRFSVTALGDPNRLEYNGFPKALGTANTDENGNYSIRCNSKIFSLYLSSQKGTRHSLEGPWTSSTKGLDFDLSKSSFFCLRGKVFGLDGKPAGGNDYIWALDEKGNILSTASADKEGNYELWSTQQIKLMKFGNWQLVQIVKEGNWNKNGELNIDYSKDANTIITGKVLDEDGKPFKGSTTDYEVFGKDNIRHFKFGAGGKGLFTLYTNWEVKKISTVNHIKPKSKIEGNWSGKQTVTLVRQSDKSKYYEITGSVTINGKSAGGCVMLQAQCADGSTTYVNDCSSGYTDKNGEFRVKINKGKELAFLIAYQTTEAVKWGSVVRAAIVEGPWKEGQKITFDIAKLAPLEISGTVTDAAGKPAVGAYMQFCGGLDGRRYLQGTIWPDANGKYKFYISQEIQHLNACNSDGSGMQIKKNIRKSSVVDFTLGAEQKYFLLTISLKDPAGKKLKGDRANAIYQVVALDNKGESLGRSLLENDGSYVLKIPEGKKVFFIKAHGPLTAGLDDRFEKEIKGEWTKDADIEIQLEKFKGNNASAID